MTIGNAARTALRALAIFAAVLIVGAECGFGVIYAWITASPHGPALAGVAVAMAAGLEIFKPFAVAGVFSSLRTWAFGRALACTLIAIAATAYSLTAELTFQAMMRGDMTAARGASAEERFSLEAKAARIEDALAAIPEHRPAAVVDVALVTLANLDPAVWARTKGCTAVTQRASAEACRPALALQGELAAAREAARLEGELSTVREALTKTGGKSIGAADPGAAALAAYALALGYAMDADRISPWLPLIGVLALQFGAAFAGVLVGWVFAATAAPDGQGSALVATKESRQESAGEGKRETSETGLPDRVPGAIPGGICDTGNALIPGRIPDRRNGLLPGQRSQRTAAGKAAEIPSLPDPRLSGQSPVKSSGGKANERHDGQHAVTPGVKTKVRHAVTPEAQRGVTAPATPSRAGTATGNPLSSALGTPPGTDTAPVKAWAAERLRRTVGQQAVAGAVLYADYRAWADRGGWTPVARETFGKAMGKTGARRTRRNGRAWFAGVALKRAGNGKNAAMSSAKKRTAKTSRSPTSRNGIGKRRALGSSPLKTNESIWPGNFEAKSKTHANGHDISKANGKAHPIAN